VLAPVAQVQPLVELLDVAQWPRLLLRVGLPVLQALVDGSRLHQAFMIGWHDGFFLALIVEFVLSAGKMAPVLFR
jgi:hypothetical protein